MSLEHFVSYSLAEALLLEKPRWLVHGLISAMLTLITGKPKSGKSGIVVSLISSIFSQGSFLGREIGPVARVILIGTDAGAVNEYRDRLVEAGVTPELAGNRLVLVPASRLDAEFCARLRAELLPQAGDLVIFDHLSDMAGDFNSQSDVSSVFAAMRDAAGEAAIVVVAHSSTATGQNGFAPTKALGSTVIAAKARWILHVEERGGDRRKLTTSGNGAKGEVLLLDVGAHVADLSVADIVTAEQRAEKARTRSGKTLDQRALQLQWYQEHCAAVSKAEAARKLAAQFGGNARSWQNHLSPSGWMGEMLASRSHALTVSPPIT